MSDDVIAAGHADDATRTADAAASRRRWSVVAGRVGVLILGLIAWELLAGNVIHTFYLPKPAKVIGELVEWIQDGSLLGHILATLIPAVKGFLIATTAALVLGYALALSRYLSDVLEPFIAGFYGVPIIALVPLMILWAGIGQGLAVSVAVLASFFLMFYNVYFGIRDVSQTLVDQVLIAGGSRWDIAFRVRLPSALVWVVAGMKVAVPHSMVGVVVAEFLTGNRGLGFLLASNANQFNAAGTFAAVAVLGSISFSLDRLLYIATRRALMWKEAGRRS